MHRTSSENKDILLNTLEIWVFCYIVLKLIVFTHFTQFHMWSKSVRLRIFHIFLLITRKLIDTKNLIFANMTNC